MNVDFVTAIKLFFANYVNFKGRSTRAEYWWAMLFVFLVSCVMNLFNAPALSGLVSLAFIIPNLAILTRRFHDTGRSGWWVVGLYVASLIGCAIAFGSVGAAFIKVALSGASDIESIQAFSEAIASHIGVFSIGMLIASAAGIWSFVITLLPSAPDNQFGPNPYGESTPEIKE
ncbi:MAG: DUF805 domain-containing protein [Muribaculaceae bacterium]|nr:DUF805 domain-containing protein [Muribaculaceae bacterium]